MASSSQRKLSLTDIDKAKLKQTFDTSHFDFNAILRGMQLTLVGAHRAMQNPAIFTNKHYKQAAYAVLAGIAIRLLVSVPILAIRLLLYLLSFVYDLSSTSWDDHVISTLHFIETNVLQIPIFLMTLMRYATPAMDNLFMDSLRWVDHTYSLKHSSDDPSKLRPGYYEPLRRYPVRDGSSHSSSTAEALSLFLIRFAKRGAISLAVYLASYIPYVGRLVLPAASFYTFNRAVGLGPAGLIFSTSIVLPRRYLVIFLQTYFASRSLTRELLEPYFARVRFTSEQKRRWFRSREGLLFGFGIGFYTLLRVPLLGVLIYGIAEASTAYLITKITDPPPTTVEESEAFAESQTEWRNRHEFLKLRLGELDRLNERPPAYEEVDPNPRGRQGNATGVPERSGTVRAREAVHEELWENGREL